MNGHDGSGMLAILEIRQGLLQNFSREERGYDWPAYWYIDDCHKM